MATMKQPRKLSAHVGTFHTAAEGLDCHIPCHVQVVRSQHTFRSTMSRPRMSWPMLCPNPQRAPIRVALMLLLPMVSGVRACAILAAFIRAIKDDACEWGFIK